jgi:hypothetical protein
VKIRVKAKNHGRDHNPCDGNLGVPEVEYGPVANANHEILKPSIMESLEFNLDVLELEIIPLG